jgi:hypothetical protein
VLSEFTVHFQIYVDVIFFYLNHVSYPSSYNPSGNGDREHTKEERLPYGRRTASPDEEEEASFGDNELSEDEDSDIEMESDLDLELCDINIDSDSDNVSDLDISE